MRGEQVTDQDRVVGGSENRNARLVKLYESFGFTHIDANADDDADADMERQPREPEVKAQVPVEIQLDRIEDLTKKLEESVIEAKASYDRLMAAPVTKLRGTSYE